MKTMMRIISEWRVDAVNEKSRQFLRAGLAIVNPS